MNARALLSHMHAHAVGLKLRGDAADAEAAAALAAAGWVRHEKVLQGVMLASGVAAFACVALTPWHRAASVLFGLTILSCATLLYVRGRALKRYRVKAQEVGA